MDDESNRAEQHAKEPDDAKSDPKPQARGLSELIIPHLLNLNFNPEDGRRNKPISKDEAMAELIQVVREKIISMHIKGGQPCFFEDKLGKNRKSELLKFLYFLTFDSLILKLKFVDDVEFWFPPGKNSIVEYRSTSRLGNFDFNVNKKRIKVVNGFFWERSPILALDKGPKHSTALGVLNLRLRFYFLFTPSATPATSIPCPPPPRCPSPKNIAPPIDRNPTKAVPVYGLKTAPSKEHKKKKD